MALFDWRARLREGVVIPAHPLALDAHRKLDERRQRALTRYYLAAGAGGIAAGVHTTQFAIRERGLYEPVLALARGGGARGRGQNRGRVRPAAAGGGGSGVRRAPRLPRRAGQLRRPAPRRYRAVDRARRRRGRGDAAVRLLPAAGRGRAPAGPRILAALRRARMRGRHQNRALQSLPDLGRTPWRRRIRPRGSRSRSIPATTITSSST